MMKQEKNRRFVMKALGFRSKDDGSHLVVWRLLDGKMGHENQTLGFLEELGRLISVDVYDVRNLRKGIPRPDMIVGAGHRTHWRLLKWSWRFNALSVVLMKPSFPMAWFDYCLVPEHDLEGRDPRGNVLVTAGVMNRVSPGEKHEEGLILLGGASAEFGWDADQLEASISDIVSSDHSVRWTVADSRRTEPTFLSRLKHLDVDLFSHRDCSDDWLPGRFAAAKKCWVTEDSVSMVYESLSSGAAVGLLPMPPSLKKGGRVRRGIHRLVNQGTVLLYRRGECVLPGRPPVEPFAESRRCAQAITNRMAIKQESLVLSSVH